MQDFPTTSSFWSMAVLWQWSNHRLDSSGLVLSYFICIYVEMYLLFAVCICYHSFAFDEVFFLHFIKAPWVGLSCLSMGIECYFKQCRAASLASHCLSRRVWGLHRSCAPCRCLILLWYALPWCTYPTASVDQMAVTKQHSISLPAMPL